MEIEAENESANAEKNSLNTCTNNYFSHKRKRSTSTLSPPSSNHISPALKASISNLSAGRNFDRQSVSPPNKIRSNILENEILIIDENNRRENQYTDSSNSSNSSHVSADSSTNQTLNEVPSLPKKTHITTNSQCCQRLYTELNSQHQQSLKFQNLCVELRRQLSSANRAVRQYKGMSTRHKKEIDGYESRLNAKGIEIKSLQALNQDLSSKFDIENSNLKSNILSMQMKCRSLQKCLDIANEKLEKSLMECDERVNIEQRKSRATNDQLRQKIDLLTEELRKEKNSKKSEISHFSEQIELTRKQLETKETQYAKLWEQLNAYMENGNEDRLNISESEAVNSPTSSAYYVVERILSHRTEPDGSLSYLLK